MKVLIGTTNPSKRNWLQELLSDCNIEFCTLRDLNIFTEPQENGKNPEENAIIKAKYYGQFFETVICHDSGLYFDELAMEDGRQPGLHVRTPQGRRLDDEEMIRYYSGLVASLGGKVTAYYLDGTAVYHHGNISSFMESGEAVKARAFYMTDTPSEIKREGWPLNSLSLKDKENSKYDTERNISIGEYQKRLIQFLKKALEIEA